MDRNAIYHRATELGKLLAKTEELALYRSAEAALLKDPEASELLQRLRTLQVAQTDAALTDEDEQAVDELWAALASLPVGAAFVAAQATVQALFATVSQIIADGAAYRSDELAKI